MIVVKQSLLPVASRWRHHYYYIQTNRSAYCTFIMSDGQCYKNLIITLISSWRWPCTNINIWSCAGQDCDYRSAFGGRLNKAEWIHKVLPVSWRINRWRYDTQEILTHRRGMSSQIGSWQRPHTSREKQGIIIIKQNWSQAILLILKYHKPQIILNTLHFQTYIQNPLLPQLWPT